MAKYKKIDLSHTIEDGMITYKGLPAPHICDFWSRAQSADYYEDGARFHIGKIDMVANTGTYIDAPFHRYEEGEDISQLSLDQIAQVECICIKTGETVTEINKSYFDKIDVKGKAVLVFTNWSRHWRTESYFENHPYLTKDAATYLQAQEVKLVGIDSYNIDDTKGTKRPVHTVLLGSNIPIVEHLCNLDQLPFYETFLFSAVPPKVKGLGSFPVRAFAMVRV